MWRIPQIILHRSQWRVQCLRLIKLRFRSLRGSGHRYRARHIHKQEEAEAFQTLHWQLHRPWRWGWRARSGPSRSWARRRHTPVQNNSHHPSQTTRPSHGTLQQQIAPEHQAQRHSWRRRWSRQFDQVASGGCPKRSHRDLLPQQRQTDPKEGPGFRSGEQMQNCRRRARNWGNHRRQNSGRAQVQCVQKTFYDNKLPKSLYIVCNYNSFANYQIKSNQIWNSLTHFWVKNSNLNVRGLFYE